MKPLRLIRTTTIKLAFYILAGNDKKCTLFDYICFRDVKHKPIDFSPSDRIKTARQIGERKISKVLNPTGSRNRQTIYSLPRFLASLILFQKFFKNLKYNSHNLWTMPFVSTNNNHANEKTTCLLIFRSHVSCLLWETENKQWELSGQTLSVSDTSLARYLRRLHKIPFQLPYKLCIFIFPLALGCPLKRASAAFSFIKKFSSKPALQNRFVHPRATVTHSKKKAKFSHHSYWFRKL